MDKTSLLHKIRLPPEIEHALQSGADLVISISGGKDSDAMCELLPTLHQRQGWTGRLALVHANLHDSEWSMTEAYVQQRAVALELPLHIVTRRQGTLLEHIHQRHHQRPDAPPFPSAAARYCTSDHKRNPIDSFLRHFKPTGAVVCAIGLRAEESPARAKKPSFQIRAGITTQRRAGYDWHPLLNFTLEDVWAALGVALPELSALQTSIRRQMAAGKSWQQAVAETHWRWHPAYALGNERLSCALCVLASRNDLMNGIAFHPAHYRELVDIELQSGFSFRQGLWLADLRPDLLTEQQRTHPLQHPPPLQPKSAATIQLEFDLCPQDSME